MQGILVTLEGIDGCGKSTQGRLLAEGLAASGARVVHTFEPGGTPWGEGVRALFLRGEERLSPVTELFLMAADRREHVDRVIQPALAEGAVVVCERYVDSTVAYQGFGRSLPLEWIFHANELATGGLLPSLTLWLDLPLHEARRRRSDRTDRLEAEEARFHERVRDGYRWLWEEHPERVARIDATGSPEEVYARIAQKLRDSGILTGGSR